LVSGSEPRVGVLSGPSSVGPGQERAVGAVGLTLAVGEETRGRKLSQFGGVGDFVGSRAREKKGGGRRAHGPKVVKGEGQEGDVLGIEGGDDGCATDGGGVKVLGGAVVFSALACHVLGRVCGGGLGQGGRSWGGEWEGRDGGAVYRCDGRLVVNV
jgi:hypothetical protein